VTVEAQQTAYFNTWPWAFWSFPGEVEETEGDES
jgi:hypothetical protein